MRVAVLVMHIHEYGPQAMKRNTEHSLCLVLKGLYVSHISHALLGLHTGARRSMHLGAGVVRPVLPTLRRRQARLRGDAAAKMRDYLVEELQVVGKTHFCA